MMTPEGKLKKYIDEKLKELAPAVWYFKPVSNGMGVHGIPDFIGSYRGRFFAIETKAPGKKPTALQNLQIDSIVKSAGKVRVIHNIEEFNTFMWELTAI